MGPCGSAENNSYGEKFFQAGKNLYNTMRYLVFVYIVGSALAITAVAITGSPGSANFSLSVVLVAYGVAGLAVAIFLYAFIQLLILACCAYGEWLCEQKSESDADD